MRFKRETRESSNMAPKQPQPIALDAHGTLTTNKESGGAYVCEMSTGVTAAICSTGFNPVETNDEVFT